MDNRCCGTCKHLVVPPDKDGVSRTRKAERYECAVEVMPDYLAVPHSVRAWHSFKWPPHRSRVSPRDGTDCSFWNEKEKKK